jgi:hypothetical protein
MSQISARRKAKSTAARAHWLAERRGFKQITVEDYVAANRARFDTDGRYAMSDARLRAV